MRYKVASSTLTKITVAAKFGDSDVEGNHPAVVAELTPENGVGATLTITALVSGSDTAESLKALYKVGAVLNVAVTV